MPAVMPTTMITIIVIKLYIMRVLYKFKIIDAIKNVLPMIFSSVVMGVVGFGLQQISGHMLWQFISIGICVMVYFSVLLVLFSTTREEVLKLYKKIVMKS